MHGFVWNGVVGASAGLGLGLVAVIAFSRRRTGRRAAPETLAVTSEPRRRIDVVAIDEVAERSPGREPNA
jgi:hypothetical protein